MNVHDTARIPRWGIVTFSFLRISLLDTASGPVLPICLLLQFLASALGLLQADRQALVDEIEPPDLLLAGTLKIFEAFSNTFHGALELADLFRALILTVFEPLGETLDGAFELADLLLAR